jgi:hypothetical protein
MMRSSPQGRPTPHKTHTYRPERRSRIGQPVSWVSLTDTWTMERGISAERTDSESVALPRLPFTKYDDRYAAALTAGCGLIFRSTNPNPYCGASSASRWT